MRRADRIECLSALEKARGSRVLAWFLADRETHPPSLPGFSIQMSNEAQLLLRDLLARIGRVPRLDLVIYTRGGGIESVWPTVNMLRDHCESLSVLVPFRAHSAGTLLALGADQVVMSDSAELSPIDPTTGNQFNPRDPANQANQYGISVEDVMAYFQLAKSVAGIDDEAHKTDVLTQLTNNVHPLALGNVQRVYMLIRRLAKRLLALHLDESDEALEAMVEGLTTDFYTHMHSIARCEAVELLGDWIVAPEDDTAVALEALFQAYLETFELRSKYCLPEIMGDAPKLDTHVKGGVLESTDASYVFETHLVVAQRAQLPPQVQVQVPPGQQIPLEPWAQRAYDFGIQGMGWVPEEAAKS
jgi:Serine dehydrogenase proteinase